MIPSRLFRRFAFLFIVALALAAILLITLFGPAAAESLPLQAASDHADDMSRRLVATPIVCPSTGTVKLAANIVGVNVRAEPSYTAAIIADAIKPNVSYPVEAASGSFYKLCASGWVARVSQSGQVLLDFTAAAPTATPIIPTRIPSPTGGPTPTTGFVWVEFNEGTLFQCPLPCVISIYDRLPNR